MVQIPNSKIDPADLVMKAKADILHRTEDRLLSIRSMLHKEQGLPGGNDYAGRLILLVNLWLKQVRDIK